MPNRLLNAKEQDGVTLELKEDEYLLDKFLEAQDAKTLKAVRESTLVFEGKVRGIDEFNDWSIEGLRAFRKKVMPIILGFTEALKGEMPE